VGRAFNTVPFPQLRAYSSEEGTALAEELTGEAVHENWRS
jgi:hypothetical protein